MSDLNNTTMQTPLAEQKIYKTKFCFAVIPAIILSFLSLIGSLANLALISQHFNLIITVVSSLICALCYLAFTIILFIKRPNILIPISLGMSMLSPTLISIIGNLILSKSRGGEYNITLWTVCILISEFIAIAACILFVLKAPAIKAFIKKTGLIWSIVVPLFCIVCNMTGSVIVNINNYSLKYALPSLIANFLNYSLEAVMLFLLYLWLANPYKEVKPAPQKPTAAPLYVQPVVPVQPVQMPVATPVQVAPPIVAPAVQPPVATPVRPPVSPPPVVTPESNQSSTTVADEIAKYKALLDTGAITPEEFESLKTKLINKI